MLKIFLYDELLYVYKDDKLLLEQEYNTPDLDGLITSLTNDYGNCKGTVEIYSKLNTKLEQNIKVNPPNRSDVAYLDTMKRVYNFTKRKAILQDCVFPKIENSWDLSIREKDNLKFLLTSVYDGLTSLDTKPLNEESYKTMFFKCLNELYDKEREV